MAGAGVEFWHLKDAYLHQVKKNGIVSRWMSEDRQRHKVENLLGNLALLVYKWRK